MSPAVFVLLSAACVSGALGCAALGVFAWRELRCKAKGHRWQNVAHNEWECLRCRQTLN